MLFRTLGTLLTNPDFAKRLLDAYTTEERLARAGKFKLLPEKIRAKRKLIAQILNATLEEDKDKPRIDPDKVTDEEIMEVIQNMGTPVPDTRVKVDMLPEDQQQKLFPEYVIYKNAKGRDKQFYDQYLAGIETSTAEIKQDDKDGQISSFDLLNLVKPTEEEEQPEQPMQAQQPAIQSTQQPTGLENIFSSADYGNLFPDDPMGEMIAQRREKGVNRG